MSLHIFPSRLMWHVLAIGWVVVASLMGGSPSSASSCATVKSSGCCSVDVSTCCCSGVFGTLSPALASPVRSETGATLATSTETPFGSLAPDTRSDRHDVEGSSIADVSEHQCALACRCLQPRSPQAPPRAPSGSTPVEAKSSGSVAPTAGARLANVVVRLRSLSIDDRSVAYPNHQGRYLTLSRLLN